VNDAFTLSFAQFTSSLLGYIVELSKYEIEWHAVQ